MALNGWTSKAPLTINNTLVTADLTNFTLLLNASSVPPEMFGTTGGCNADGSDIRFSTDNSGNTLLDFDLVTLDKATSTLIVYVKCDLANTTDTVIYIFWGNSGAQLPASNTWSDFYGVIHFQEDTSVGDGFKTAKDSAGTYNAMSESGNPTYVNGKVVGHKAWQMTNANYAVLEEEMNISGDFFFEFLINYNGTAPSAGLQNLFAPVDYFSGVGSVGIGINYGALVLRDTSIGGAQCSNWNTWNHVAFYRTGNTVYYYLNGNLHASGNFTNNIERLKWLSSAGGGKAVQYPAVDYSISSLKFTRNTAIPDAADVIKTRWNNIDSLSTFITAGSVETVSIQTTLTLVNLKPNSEVRIYDLSMNELAGVENSTDTFTYNYSYTGDIDSEIVIHSLGYQYIRLPLTLSSTSNTIPIQQQVDRNYSNP